MTHHAGWIKTFTQYFVDQTKHIITNIIDALDQVVIDPSYCLSYVSCLLTSHRVMRVCAVLCCMKDASRTFIWAEISYFSFWWDEQSSSRKATVKR